ncbi:Gfo/Idh/MocA family protein [Acidipila sp. EB88]|uniref:Gfo/Idh/MocA family protein n=1 Tax=Acidipila sp. EB88 TaxID=2305226 RepID=UPI000F602FB8|nr:Gfo/Idh/MocA family oxidoreductase [Acidipila sp. EB88]RRA48272.1 gfo/Idh/MocA family oxidoreductase [Acidipila sp. EB88]
MSLASLPLDPGTLHLAVCGAGAFGRNHVRVYRELAAADPSLHLAAVVDPDPARIADAGVPVFRSTEDMLAAIARGDLRVDAASVCVPTSLHHAVAAQLLAAGIHVLVEKPISSTLAEADDLIALAAQYQRVLMVGHLERFNPAVAALAPLLRGPMFFEAHRLSIFSPRSLDVDVVLDLMIHDLDIVLHLAQSAVRHVHAVGLPILSRKTDIANVRVEFESGCVANFTASRVSTERVRKLRFFQPHQYLSIDYARQDLLVIEVQPPASAPVPPIEAPAAGSSLPTLGMQKPSVQQGEPLRLELQAFLHAIRSSEAPAVTGADARAALALALQIQQAIEAHAQHAGLQAFVAGP